MLDRKPLRELTAAQLFDRAIELAEKAKRAEGSYLEGAFGRLAVLYAQLAGRRETEEKQAGQY